MIKTNNLKFYKHEPIYLQFYISNINFLTDCYFKLKVGEASGHVTLFYKYMVFKSSFKYSILQILTMRLVCMLAIFLSVATADTI